ncbi:MAG: radical SAM protein [Desulfitobacteriaceae bacterium]|nr:radical SAM protein [Desulfitobacteriaceae bacterium]
MSQRQITYLNIELTNQCGLQCAHCSSSSSFDGTDYIAPNRVLRLLDEGKKLGAKCLSISGGEPLLYPYLNEIIEYANTTGYTIRIYTSGIITKDGVELRSIAEETLKSFVGKIDTIIFSLHSHLATLHDGITCKKGSFDLTTKAIRAAIKIGLITEIHTVPMSVNYKDIPHLISLGEDIGVRQVSFLRLVPQGRCVNNPHLMMNVAETKQFVEILNEMDSPVLKLRKGAPYKCLFIEKAGECSAGKDKILISPDGSVHPCEAFKFSSSRSNINTQSLTDIWMEDSMLNQIRMLDILQISECNTCGNINVCHGGCPGQRYLEYHSIEQGPDPICLIGNAV